jgi:hypothetical protein
MLKCIHRILATAACGLTLGLLAVPSAHAEPKVLATGRADRFQVYVLVWVDTDHGPQLDDNAAKQFRDAFADSDWSILDNNQVVISKHGKLLVRASYLAWEDQTIFPFHAQVSSQIVDGTIYRFQEEPRKGYGMLFITELANDGRSSRSVRIEADLRFP